MNANQEEESIGRSPGQASANGRGSVMDLAAENYYREEDGFVARLLGEPIIHSFEGPLPAAARCVQAPAVNGRDVARFADQYFNPTGKPFESQHFMDEDEVVRLLRETIQSFDVRSLLPAVRGVQAPAVNRGEDLHDEGVPPPVFPHPQIDPAGNPIVSVRPHGGGEFQLETVFLVPAGPDPQHCYELPDNAEISVNHRSGKNGVLWGFSIFGARRLRKVGPDKQFERPAAYDEDSIVAIKVVSVDDAERSFCGSPNLPNCENPYKEIFFLRELQDGGETVIPLLDAFEDTEDSRPFHHEALLNALQGPCVHKASGLVTGMKGHKWLYIVTPFCPKGDLEDRLWKVGQEAVANGFPTGSRGLPIAEIRGVDKQLAKIDKHLKSKSICHHDVSTTNLLDYKGHWVISDPAKAFFLPNEKGRDGRLRKVKKEYRGGGTVEFQPPFQYAPFAAELFDSFCFGAILYRCFEGSVNPNGSPQRPAEPGELIRRINYHPTSPEGAQKRRMACIPFKAKKMLKAVLQTDESRRSTYHQASKKHNWKHQKLVDDR